MVQKIDSNTLSDKNDHDNDVIRPLCIKLPKLLVMLENLRLALKLLKT